jgi:hypothetical protein
MPDDENLSDLDRRSLRILARSSRNAPAGDRLSSRLERAAETGSRQDYEKAEQTFDSLPPEDRVKIGAKAEKQAETERELVLSRKRWATATPPPAKDKGDDTLDWQPIFAAREPADETPATPAPKAKVPPPPSAKSWDLGTATPKRKAAPPKKKPTVDHRTKLATPASADEDAKDWDWRRIPDEPVMSGGRQSGSGPADPIEELRRQMLGLDANVKK